MGFNVGEVLVRALGAALLAWAACMPLLGMFGAETDATVTQVRRLWGERDEALPNRYTYSVSYQFTLSDGRVVDASTQMIGDFGNIQGLNAAQPLRVRYLPFWPALNSPSTLARPKLEHLLIAVVGWMLLVGFWRGKRRRRNANRRTPETEDRK